MMEKCTIFDAAIGILCNKYSDLCIGNLWEDRFMIFFVS